MMKTETTRATAKKLAVVDRHPRRRSCFAPGPCTVPARRSAMTGTGRTRYGGGALPSVLAEVPGRLEAVELVGHLTIQRLSVGPHHIDQEGVGLYGPPTGVVDRWSYDPGRSKRAVKRPRVDLNQAVSPQEVNLFDPLDNGSPV